ncbi:hypothetical protein FZEAL_6751 [Fusarium zealandicum]|uniref:Calcium influx-promoting protein ehs1 n=1 Tax=Fusarium zealandicum TaxID=1053134 RepID=A0A8H4UHZ4_9HYPO|nr:hypothetical protein FZEAL_6751 [Fusarium zealandicum]
MTLNSPISRPYSSITASLLALLLFCAPSIANAAEVPVDSLVYVEPPIERADGLDIIYEPDFAPFDRSIIGRAPAGIKALGNNGVVTQGVNPGDTACFMIERKALFGDDKKGARDLGDLEADETTDSDNEDHQNSRRAKTRTVYISANTCKRPNVVTKKKETKLAPQLSLYVSTTDKVQCPDAASYEKSSSGLKKVSFEEGAVMYSINATDDIYLSIAAPNITEKYNSTYTFDIAISFEEFYHKYDSSNSSAKLLWMDSDSSSALLVTSNLTDDSTETQTIMRSPPPYQIFVGGDKDGAIDGLRHSVCGLEESAQIWTNSDGTGQSNTLVKTGMTTRGPGQLPKQQFLLAGLKPGNEYAGILVYMPNNKNKRQSGRGSVGAGGTVMGAIGFNTSSATNCNVVTDLEFCNETQYAVPGNDKKYNNTELARVYDDYAKKMYANFEKVLAQISCEAVPDSRYSLARDCSQCREAYKRWLCTVSIPRCEDVIAGGHTSVIRNAAQAFPNGTKLASTFLKGLVTANNASRNAFIDKTIKPGPYKEMLPCEDICYDVVQSCPAAIGFNCPQPGFPSFDVSYGQRAEDGVTCNYPGEARTKFSAAGAVIPGALLLVALPLMIWLGL